MSAGVHSSTGSTLGHQRTCVGCRERAALSDLMRVVAVSGACVPDIKRRLPGRGANLHPDLRCLERAERRKAFPRALRVPGPLDLAALRDAVSARPSEAAAPEGERPEQGSSGSGAIRG